MKNSYQYSAILFLSLFLLFSCDEDPIPELPPQADFSKGILILNEGTPTANDGEVYHYDPDLDVLTPNLFDKANGKPFDGILVDVLQVDDRIYLVSSTGKVEVVNAIDFTSRATIVDGLVHPSSIAVVGEKLFIADFGPEPDDLSTTEAFVAVIDGLDGGPISTKTSVDPLPEVSLTTSFSVVATSRNSGRILLLNTSDGQIGLTLGSNLPYQTGGAFVGGLGANFYQFDENRISLLTTLFPSFVVDMGRELDLPNATRKFAVLSNTEFMLITSSGLAGQNDAVQLINYNGRSPLTASEFISGTNFNGIGFDVPGDRLYLGDSKGGAGNGEVRIYQRDGSVVKTLIVGKNPSGFYSRERMR
jgi:hypothetical protein